MNRITDPVIGKLEANVGGFDTTIELERDKEKYRGGIDLKKKQARVQLNPEGVKEVAKSIGIIALIVAALAFLAAILYPSKQND